MTKGLTEEKRSREDGRQQKSEGLPLSPQYRINGADLCVVTKTVIKATIRAVCATLCDRSTKELIMINYSISKKTLAIK